MANVKCPNCDRDISELASFCPYCSAKQESLPTPVTTTANELPPGWYERPGHLNTLSYFDGEDFTGQVAPAQVKLHLGRLVQGVALGVVCGTFVTGFIAFLVALAIRK